MGLAKCLTVVPSQPILKMNMTEKETIPAENEEMNINADADVPGNTHLSNEGAIDAIEKMQNEIDEQKDKYLRLVAEFDNFKRRNAKERIELIQIAGKDVIFSLLEVLDDCDRAEKQIQEAVESDINNEGILLIFNKLRGKLQSRGLKAMDCLDTDFDVEQHEAITDIPVEADKQGKVVDEIEKGYYLNGKIIRFAKVVVGK